MIYWAIVVMIVSLCACGGGHGDDGLSGSDGISCDGRRIANGIEVRCGDTIVDTLSDGIAGENCTLRASNRDSAYLACGADSFHWVSINPDDLHYSSSSIMLSSSSSLGLLGSWNTLLVYGDWVDVRDEHHYRTIKIGSQTWMAENLNYETTGSTCYGGNNENCFVYGRLYNWESALLACPVGWHLPDSVEWLALLDVVGGGDVAGAYLKTASGWARGGNGEDTYGFSALPGGACSEGLCDFVGFMGLWWSSTELETERAWRFMLQYNGITVFFDSNSDGVADFSIRKERALSVRCVENS